MVIAGSRFRGGRTWQPERMGYRDRVRARATVEAGVLHTYTLHQSDRFPSTKVCRDPGRDSRQGHVSPRLVACVYRRSISLRCVGIGGGTQAGFLASRIRLFQLLQGFFLIFVVFVAEAWVAFKGPVFEHVGEPGSTRAFLGRPHVCGRHKDKNRDHGSLDENKSPAVLDGLFRDFLLEGCKVYCLISERQQHHDRVMYHQPSTVILHERRWAGLSGGGSWRCARWGGEGRRYRQEVKATSPGTRSPASAACSIRYGKGHTTR